MLTTIDRSSWRSARCAVCLPSWRTRMCAKMRCGSVQDLWISRLRSSRTRRPRGSGRGRKMSSRNERPKQVDRILDYMRRYGSITTLDAMLDLASWRLASRISELKKAVSPSGETGRRSQTATGKRATYCATASMAALPSFPISPGGRRIRGAPPIVN